MIARLLRLLWCITIALAVVAAWCFIHLLGDRIGPWAAGLLGVFVVGALHPAAIVFQFACSRIAGDPVPPPFRLTAWQAIKTLDAEIDASVRGMWFATPLLSHRPAPKPSPDRPLRPTPVLFVHGYFCNRAVWSSFMHDAAARGYLCEAVTLPDPFASIDSQVPVVHAAVDALLLRARAADPATARVAIVAHSMGGLVVRAALAQGGSARIGHVVTLGTPHHGTHAARFGRQPNVVQMRRGSAWLAALDARDLSTRASFTTVFSHHDDIVYPQTTAALAGARQIAIGGCGHVALLYDRRVREIVFETLSAADESDRAQAAIDGAAVV